MDIQKIMQTGTAPPSKKTKEAPQPGVQFSEVMNQRRSEKAYERFTKMIQDIDDQGKALAESRTVEELKKYKKLVKDFMESVEQGIHLEEKHGFNRRGRTKVYKIVEEVDQKLIDLTDAVMDQQKSSIDILDKVGEIKGLLVNMYV
ncbi:YaaR family protein [Salibacterium sp. K-3]